MDWEAARLKIILFNVVPAYALASAGKNVINVVFNREYGEGGVIAAEKFYKRWLMGHLG